MPYVKPSTSSNPQPDPISRYSARASYYGPSGFQPSVGLERARRPFRTKNALTGLGIMGFVAAVYTYSISAVKQDDFSDLPSTNPNAGQEGIKTIEEELAEKGSRMGAQRGVGALMGYGSSPQGTGVRVASEPAAVAGMHNTQPASSPQSTPLSSPLPPSSSTSVAAAASLSTTASTSTRPASKLIIGAPDVDRLGRLGERSDQETTIDGRRVA